MLILSVMFHHFLSLSFVDYCSAFYLVFIITLNPKPISFSSLFHHVSDFSIMFITSQFWSLFIALVSALLTFEYLDFCWHPYFDRSILI